MLPFKEDKKIKLTSDYGNRTFILNGKPYSDFHTGIDLVPVPYKSGDEILAFEDGIVTKLQKIGEQWGTACFVRIKHANGLYTLYYHLKSNSIVVNVGDNVKKGDKLGIIGTTGQSSGIHLHFQIDKGNNKTAINPYDYVFNGKPLIEPIPEPIPAPVEPKFKVGDKVVPIKLVNWKGTKLIQYDDVYTITELNDKTAVLSAPRKGKMEVWARMNISDIKLKD